METVSQWHTARTVFARFVLWHRETCYCNYSSMFWFHCSLCRDGRITSMITVFSFFFTLCLYRICFIHVILGSIKFIFELCWCYRTAFENNVAIVFLGQDIFGASLWQTHTVQYMVNCGLSAIKTPSRTNTVDQSHLNCNGTNWDCRRWLLQRYSNLRKESYCKVTVSYTVWINYEMLSHLDCLTYSVCFTLTLS